MAVRCLMFKRQIRRNASFITKMGGHNWGTKYDGGSRGPHQAKLHSQAATWNHQLDTLLRAVALTQRVTRASERLTRVLQYEAHEYPKPVVTFGRPRRDDSGTCEIRGDGGRFAAEGQDLLAQKEWATST